MSGADKELHVPAGKGKVRRNHAPEIAIFKAALFAGKEQHARLLVALTACAAAQASAVGFQRREVAQQLAGAENGV